MPASKRAWYQRPFCPRSPGGSNGQTASAPQTSQIHEREAATRPAGPPCAALRSCRRCLALCKQCGRAHDPWVRGDRAKGSPPAPGVPACNAKRACPRRPASYVCWPAARVHAWTGGATAGTGHPQSVGCAHLELHVSLRATRVALAPPTAWRATAAPEARPPAMKVVQIVVSARPGAHDTSLPPARGAACLAIRPMLGYGPSTTSGLRQPECWQGDAVAP